MAGMMLTLGIPHSDTLPSNAFALENATGMTLMPGLEASPLKIVQ